MLEKFNNLIFLLEQTAKEKKLTILYIGFFLLFVTLLIVDMYGQKKYAGGKVINKIIFYFFALALIAFIIVVLVLK